MNEVQISQLRILIREEIEYAFLQGAGQSTSVEFCELEDKWEEFAQSFETYL